CHWLLQSPLHVATSPVHQGVQKRQNDGDGEFPCPIQFKVDLKYGVYIPTTFFCPLERALHSAVLFRLADDVSSLVLFLFFRCSGPRAEWQTMLFSDLFLPRVEGVEGFRWRSFSSDRQEV
ncbi:hypothetical protein AVEN_6566-1, partial [Araneus ventricosus]